VTPLLSLKPAPQPSKQLPILYHFLREHSWGFPTWYGLGLTQGYASRYEHPKLKFQIASPAKMVNFGLIFATYFDQLLSTEGDCSSKSNLLHGQPRRNLASMPA